MDKKEKLNNEIRLLENSFELSKSNYHLWTSMFLTAVVLIFTIIQIMIEIFPNNKINVFLGGIISYLIISLTFYPKLRYEMRKSTIKYQLISNRFKELSVDTNKIDKEIYKYL
ncbi:MAG: hypothetical protein AABY16_00295 [Nanoarchaeota archaeon]